MEPANGTTARLLITCPDKPGIVAAVSNFLFSRGANIIHSDQHSSDPWDGTFFMRLEFCLSCLEDSLDKIKKDFQDGPGSEFEMAWSLNPASVKKRVAILVSKHDHALMDLLWRWKRSELHMDVGMVVSNHPDLKHDVEGFGVDFHHVPVEKGKKSEAEAAILDLFGDKVDLVVLARYMQILSGDFVEAVPGGIINIHHSFLPAFKGADPYRRAADRGVKLIGATAHYVTEELDQGPIIEQDVIRVSHRSTVDELKILGRDIERQVLARAVRWHLEDRVIVDGNKTIVFV